MDGPLIAGLDLGTTRIKAASYDLDGRPQQVASAPTPTRTPRPRRAEHDAGALWEVASGLLREVTGRLDDPGRIASVAVASVAEAGVPLDRNGQPVHPVIAWFDRRGAPQADRLAAALGADRLAEITGLRPQPIYGICKLMWLRDNHPDTFARIARWLNVADYIAYRLSGEQATDYSLASRTFALDLPAQRWSDEILEAAGVPSSLLAPLVWGGTSLGTVTSDAAAATGLPQGVTVAAGGHDHVCGALAAGVVEPGKVLDSMGTAEAVLLPLATPLPGTTRISQGAHVLPDRYYAAGGIHAGGASLDWVLRLVGAGEHDRSDLLAAAAAVPVGAHGVRYLPDGADRPGAALVGLRPDVDAPTLVRAVLEGLAAAARDILNRLAGAASVVAPPEVRLIGGGSRIPLQVAIKAAVLGRPVLLPRVTEATSLGAALLGALAAGLLDVPAASALTARAERVDPDPAAADEYAGLRRSTTRR